VACIGGYEGPVSSSVDAFLVETTDITPLFSQRAKRRPMQLTLWLWLRLRAAGRGHAGMEADCTIGERIVFILSSSRAGKSD